MSGRIIGILLSLAALIVGFGGYFIGDHLPLFAALGFIGLVALIVLLALKPDKAWSQADDLRRADQHEEHPMPEGPAPPFQN